MTGPWCPYAWCEEDHAHPETPADEHSMKVTVMVADHSETIDLSLRAGKPTMEWIPGYDEFTTDDETGVQDFVTYRDVIDKIVSTFRAFEAEHSPGRLHRHPAVDLELMGRDV